MRPEGPHAQRWSTLLREVQHQRKLLRLPEERLLWQLLRTPFLSASDLAVLLQIEQTTAYTHTQALSERGVIEACRVPAAGMNRRLFTLSNCGVYLLASLLDRDPLALATNTSSDEEALLHQLPRLRRLVLVQSVLSTLLGEAPRMQQQQKQALIWSWKRDVVPSEREEAMGLPCIDASLTWSYHPQTEWYSALMLLETDFFLREALLQKLEFLFAVRAHEQRHFPAILLLTSTSEQQHRWVQEMRNMAQNKHVPPLVGASLVLRGAFSSRAVWRRHWVALEEQRPCLLTSVVQPVSAAEVPTFLLEPEPPLPMSSFAPSKPLAVIKGRFFERALRVDADSSKEEDEETRLCLLSLSLGARHLGVVVLLYRLPFLTIRALAQLLAYQPASVQRYLAQLQQQGMVERLQVKQTRSWWVTERGLRWIALVHRLPLDRVQKHALAVMGIDFQKLASLQHQQAGSLLVFPEGCERLVGFARVLGWIDHLALTHQDLMRVRDWEVEPRTPVSAMRLTLELHQSGGWQQHDVYVLWISRREAYSPMEAVKATLYIREAQQSSALLLVAKKDRDMFLPLEKAFSALKVMTPGALGRRSLPLSMLPFASLLDCRG